MPRRAIIPEYQELIEYLAEKVPPDYLLAFKVSRKSDRRAQNLTDRNKAGTLTSDELAELEQMLEFDEFVTHLKVKRLKLNKQV